MRKARKIKLSFVAVVLVAFAVLAVMGWQITKTRQLVKSNHALALQGEQAHDAICALKADLDRRIQASLDFLVTHPNGIQGITAATIRQGIANQQLTIDALQEVTCSKP
jgi:hypothetical protein